MENVREDGQEAQDEIYTVTFLINLGGISLSICRASSVII